MRKKTLFFTVSSTKFLTCSSITIYVFLQEGMPIRFKSIHFFNIVPFMDKISAMMRPFMKKYVADSLVMHSQIDTLFNKIPKDILPEDYGGSCKSLKILHEYKVQMTENTEFFKFQESQIVDELKRAEKSEFASEVFGINGTFKKLQLD
nr:alpha-tocopherol transfer protein-like isoform X2 [Leptinotarsa decemlineata]